MRLADGEGRSTSPRRPTGGARTPDETLAPDDWAFAYNRRVSQPSRDVLFDFDDVRVGAILHADLAIPPGVTVIFGPSGAGKTTLLRLACAMQAPSSGTVSFRGEDIARVDPVLLRRRVTMVTPGASTGTAQQIAKSASSGPMLRQGMTRNSCI